VLKVPSNIKNVIDRLSNTDGCGDYSPCHYSAILLDVLSTSVVDKRGQCVEPWVGPGNHLLFNNITVITIIIIVIIIIITIVIHC